MLFLLVLLHFLAISAKLYTYSIYRFVIYYCVIFCSHTLLYKCDILSSDIFCDLAHLYPFSSSCPSVHIHMVG